MEDYIGRAEHDEFVRRIEAEDRRQNHRLNLLEETVRQTSALTISVEKLAVSMERMASEQVRTGKSSKTARRSGWGEVAQRIALCHNGARRGTSHLHPDAIWNQLMKGSDENEGAFQMEPLVLRCICSCHQNDCADSIGNDWNRSRVE